MSLLTKRHADKIDGVLSCYDRIIIQGSLLGLGYADGMASFLRKQGILIFDFPEIAKPLTELVRRNAERIAEENGLTVDYIRRPNSFRKESRIAEILASRGTHPGMVHIFSVMETCSTFEPWHDKTTHRTFLRPATGKCIHYYFYFIDPELGLCYVRVPTWAPFRLQIYFNAHNWLANRLEACGIRFKLEDNAFTEISDYQAAQRVADRLGVKRLHKAFDRFAPEFCPASIELDTAYGWSLMQVEYATDIVFKRREDLEDIYQTLIRTALYAVKVDDVAMFFGRKPVATYSGEIGTDLKRRSFGTRLKHRMGPSSIKIYDKFGRVLRIETTTNEVGFFSHYRKVVKKNGEVRFQNARVRKTIYSLNPDLSHLLRASNDRYLAYISNLEVPAVTPKALSKIGEPVRHGDRPYKGFNLFTQEDQALFELLARGEFSITGFRNCNLRTHMRATTAHVSRCLNVVTHAP
jgi:hypothetical protein